MDSLKKHLEENINENQTNKLNDKDKKNVINLQLICNSGKEKLKFLSIDDSEQQGLKLKDSDIEIFINNIKYNLSDCLNKAFYRGSYHIKLKFKKIFFKCQKMFYECKSLVGIDL